MRGGEFETVPDVEEVLCEFVDREWQGVDPDAFADRDEMGGGEETDFGGERVRALVGGEDGVYEGAGCAFAFCAGDVDDVEAVEIMRLVELEERRKKRAGRGADCVADVAERGEGVFIMLRTWLDACRSSLFQGLKLSL